jgi:hypothetical protein
MRPAIDAGRMSLRHRARWQSGHAAACKAVDAGSIPTLASKPTLAGVVEWYTHRT